MSFASDTFWIVQDDGELRESPDNHLPLLYASETDAEEDFPNLRPVAVRLVRSDTYAAMRAALERIAGLAECWGRERVVVEHIGGYPREEEEGVDAAEIARNALAFPIFED